MDDYPDYMDPEGKHGRAERVFKEELEVIVESLNLHPKHATLMCDTTKLVLACEEIPKLERKIAALSERSYVQGFNPFIEHRVSLLRDEISWYKERDFVYQLPANIVIGSVGESQDDSSYTAGMRAEIGHAIYSTLKSFRRVFKFGGKDVDDEFDDTISEFYDFICWKCTESTLNEDELYTIDFFRDSRELVWKPYGPVTYLEHKSNQRHYVALGEIIAPMLDALAEHAALPRGECLPLLVDSGAKAMYDKKVDFSSPQRFAESVIERLPVYFPRTFREKLLKVLLN